MSDVATRYPRPIPSTAARALTLGWLWLAVFSLTAAGLMAMLLALSRTPLIQDAIDNPALFKVALVVHVDLSVLIWFFACAGALYSLLAPGGRNHWDRTALATTTFGTLMITAAPFVGVADPLMNNYVPVLRHPWFFVGLLLAAAGIGIQSLRFLLQVARQPARRDVRPATTLRQTMALTAGVLLLTLACVGASWLRLPPSLTGESYYEGLFWGGGHVLQFAYTLMLLGGWMVLTDADTTAAGAAGCNRLRPLLMVVVAPLVMVPWLYSAPIDSVRHVHGFTELMRWGGLACMPLGLVAVARLWRSRPDGPDSRLLRAAAFWSMALFASGGVLGFLISGSNTMIPAHYHGSIVAVTLALMGVVYYALPRLDRPITTPRMARWQPAIYAVGQLLHVTGLAWCGGYGVQRKVAGAAQGLDGLAETAGMALMGIGGLVSVIGGVMFLLVTIAALSAGLLKPAGTVSRPGQIA
jgi:heme/copper-type cytochrome/quinol oxidase subunit 1